eukprot:Gb_00408 [translate_table: standard]
MEEQLLEHSWSSDASMEEFFPFSCCLGKGLLSALFSWALSQCLALFHLCLSLCSLLYQLLEFSSPPQPPVGFLASYFGYLSLHSPVLPSWWLGSPPLTLVLPPQDFCVLSHLPVDFTGPCSFLSFLPVGRCGTCSLLAPLAASLLPLRLSQACAASVVPRGVPGGLPWSCGALHHPRPLAPVVAAMNCRRPCTKTRKKKPR